MAEFLSIAKSASENVLIMKGEVGSVVSGFLSAFDMIIVRKEPAGRVDCRNESTMMV